MSLAEEFKEKKRVETKLKEKLDFLGQLAEWTDLSLEDLKNIHCVVGTLLFTVKEDTTSNSKEFVSGKLRAFMSFSLALNSEGGEFTTEEDIDGLVEDFRGKSAYIISHESK